MRQGERLVGKKALTMLNFRLKTRQNKVSHIHTHEQRHRKHVYLRSPRRVGTGHALKGKATLTYKFKLINSNTLQLTNSQTPKLTHKFKFKNSSTQKLTNPKAQTHKLINLKNLQPISSNSKTHQLKNSPTYKLKLKKS